MTQNDSVPDIEAEGIDPEEESQDPTTFPPLSEQSARRIIEALLFASGEPLDPSRIAEALDGILPNSEIVTEIEQLKERWASEQRPYEIQDVAGGFQIRTLPEFAPYILKLARKKKSTRLSPALLETLSIVAYRQPILRADIDAIRGVDSGALLRKLMERKLVRIVKREEVIGKPILYGTTRKFLEDFALKSVRDLPGLAEMITETGTTGDSISEQSSEPEDTELSEPPILQAIPPIETETLDTTSQESDPEDPPSV
jgi:segregation and condensation protein B